MKFIVKEASKAEPQDYPYIFQRWHSKTCLVMLLSMSINNLSLAHTDRRTIYTRYAGARDTLLLTAFSF